MKNLIFIMLVIVSTVGAFSQSESKLSGNQDKQFMPLLEFKGDTLKYVQHNFIDNKQKYVGKDLNNLLNDVEIPIKTYYPGISFLSRKLSPNMIIQFYSLAQAMYRTEMPNKPVNLIIEWAQPQPMDIVDKMWFKYHGE